MNRVNTILIFFLAFFIAMSVAGWTFLQSRTFGRILSKTVTKVLVSFDARAKFSKLSVNFFPPGIELQNVQLEYQRKGTSISAEAGKLGVVFGADILTGSRMSVAKVYLSEGFAELDFPTDEKKNQHPWDLIQEELDKLPLRLDALVISDSLVRVQETDLEIRHVQLSPSPQEIGFEGELRQIKHQVFQNGFDLVKARGNLKRSRLSLDKVQLIQKRSKLTAKGHVAWWAESEKMEARLTTEVDSFLPDLHEWVNLGQIHFSDGQVKSQLELTWSQQQGIAFTGDITIQDFASNLLHLERAVGKFKADRHSIMVTELEANQGAQQLSLLAPAAAWSFESKTILPEGVRARVRDLELNNALRILGPSLEPLKARLSGELEFRLRGQDLFFYPVDGFKLENLRLDFSSAEDKKFPIFNAPVLWLHGSELKVVDNRFDMLAEIKGPRTQLKVKGGIGAGRVNFKVEPGELQLTDLGDLANLSLKGEGTNSLTVSGPLDHVELALEGTFNQFEILGYRLGKTRHKVLIDLKEGLVELENFDARKGKFDYSGSGKVNYRDFLLDLSIDLPAISFMEFKDAIHPLADGLSFLPEDFAALLSSNVELVARKDIRNLKVGADVYGQKILAYGESIKDTKFTFLFGNKKIYLENFSLQKDSGNLQGEISYDLQASELSYKLKLAQLKSQELAVYKKLPLALEFVADGEFQGVQGRQHWRHRGHASLEQGRVHDRRVEDSRIEWDLRHDSVMVDAKIARDWILLSAHSFVDRNTPKVLFDTKINIPDLPLFLRGALGENPRLSTAEGELVLTSKVALTDWQWNKLDAEAWLERLRLKGSDLNIDHQFSAPQIRIERGEVRKWEVKLPSPELQLLSSAQGDLRDNLIIKNSLRLDGKLLEWLSRHIQRAEGRFQTDLNWKLSPQGINFEASAQSTEMSVNTSLLPFSLNNLKFSMFYRQGELELEHLSFRPNDGKFQTQGTVFFNGFHPDINLNYQLDRADIPIKNKSQVTLSGTGLIFGNRPPYTLNGDITVNSGSILNELNDFMGQSDVTTDSKFLPPDTSGALHGLVQLDVGVSIENPVVVNNSLMDVQVVGDLKLQGEPTRPSAEGKLQLVGQNSKVFFKNNEYVITKAEFLFHNKKPISRPEFDVAALSTIANYKVTAKAFGNPENFSFDLTSEPSLTRQNVLSLIAFGYTDDLSSTIDPNEKQNLTNVGVGSFIFDQFKVTDIVKKQFGLQVNLGTVFVQSDQSLLQGRSQDQGGVGALNRTRTATNIEVKKRLSEAMSLSVSSTVGGSVGQRQKMNLNYGLSPKFQLEGVYELRTNAEGTEDIIDNSIGGDLKFRQTFR